MAQTLEPQTTGRHTWLVIGAFLGICTGMVAMGSFEAMLVPLQNEFVFSVDTVNILALAVSTGSLAILFIAGSLVDRWGARRILTMGVGAMVVGAIIVMIAPGIPLLLSGRIVGGMGGMTMSVSCLAALNAEFQGDRKRAHIFGHLAAAMGVAALVSPVLGAAMAQRVSWRLVPLLWIAVALASFLLLRRVMKGPVDGPQRSELLTPLAAGVSMSSFCLGVLLLGSSGSIARLTFAVSAGALIFLMLRWKQLGRRGSPPGLDISIFKERGTIFLAVAMLFVGAVNLFFYANLFMQYRLGLDAASSAAALIVPQCAVILGGVAGGWIAGMFGSLRTTALALALGSVAALLLQLVDESSGLPSVIVFLAAFALPAGCILGTLTKSFLDQADPTASGAASSWRQGAWSLGATIGGVATGAVFFNYFSRNWQSALQQAGISEDAAAYAAEAVRGGVPLVELAATPGLEDLKVADNARTLLELTASQIETFRLISAVTAATYAISLVLVLMAMWRIRSTSRA